MGHIPGSSYFFPDFDESDGELIKKVQPFTRSTPERIYALIKAVEYVVKSSILGDIVECGVWKGGSVVVIAETLLKLKETNRNLYLFDTFEGMTKPTEEDISYKDERASDLLAEEIDREGIGSVSSYAPLDQVKQVVLSTGYDPSKVHFVKGRVEDTIPKEAPDTISLLRLDTDWYASTLHELMYLFPCLSQNGVLLIDDYGHWRGSKKATDEYFQKHNMNLLLNRIDYSARIAIKP